MEKYSFINYSVNLWWKRCSFSNWFLLKIFSKFLGYISSDLILLELIQVIEQKSRYIVYSKIVIALECQEVYYGIVKKIITTNNIVGEGDREIVAIRNAIRKVLIVIELQLKQGYPIRKLIY